MPFQKSFNIVLEESTAENEYIALNGTDSTGALNADSRVLGVDASKSEAKPSFLSEAADGSGDYAKESVTASNSGWIMKPGSPATGNDNTAAQPEVLVCVRQLKDSIDVPTAPQLTIGNTSSKTTFFPDGDTFTGAASSSLGDVTVYVYFNEPINVTGTPQLQLKQATALGSNFGTIMDVNLSVSDLSNGVLAFSLPAGEDTRTSNVTNNTLGINSDDAMSLNSGRIDKLTGDQIILEDETGSVASDGSADVGIKLENEFGFLLEEAGGGMAADLTLTLDSDATMTVS
jgi:hypothetical protein|tara:strand:- start:109 stop:972 length:864 start_codon:yes stop_codon:yes gene_type:complete